MTIKFYGYKNEDIPIELIQPLDLAEVTLVASPEELRKIAKFIESVADKIEKHGKYFEHEHLSDKQVGFENSPHFVIYNAQATE